MIFYTIFLCLLSFYSTATHQESLFEHGNQLLKEGYYQQARDVYDQITDQGAGLLYNYSVSYLHEKKYAFALLYLYKAKKQATFFQLFRLIDLENYISEQMHSDFKLSFYEQFVIFFQISVLSIPLLLLEFLLFLLCIMILLLVYRSATVSLSMKNLMRYSLLFFLIMVLFIYRYYEIKKNIGIIIKDPVSVYGGPGNLFYSPLTLHSGDIVTVFEKYEHYYKIKQKKSNGWVHESDIQLV